MPHQRPQIGPGAIPAPPLRTAARPIDAFIPPTRGGRLAQLAQGLAELAPALSGLANVLAQRQALTSREAGEEAARRLIAELDIERTTFAQAVESGLLPANMNPFMRYGFETEVGRLMAGRLSNEIRAAADTVLDGSADLSSFREFAAKYERDFLDRNIPEELRTRGFNDGYGALRDNLLAGLEANFATRAGQQFQDNMIALFQRNQVETIMNGLSSGLPLERIARNLRDNMDGKAALMPTPEFRSQLNQATVVAVATTALSLTRETGRNRMDVFDDLLAVLPSGRPGAEAPLGNTAFAKTVRNVEFGPGPGEGSLLTKIRSALDEKFKADKVENDQSADEALAAIHGMFLGGFDATEGRIRPGFDLSLEQRRQYEASRRDQVTRGNNEVVAEMDSLMDSYRNREYVDDPALVAHIQTLIAGNNHTARDVITGGLLSRRLTTETYMRLTDRARTSAQRNELDSDDDFQFMKQQFGMALGADPLGLPNLSDAVTILRTLRVDPRQAPVFLEAWRRRLQALTEQYTQLFIEGKGKETLGFAERRRILTDWVNLRTRELFNSFAGPPVPNRPAPDPDARIFPDNIIPDRP